MDEQLLKRIQKNTGIFIFASFSGAFHISIRNFVCEFINSNRTRVDPLLAAAVVQEKMKKIREYKLNIAHAATP